MTTAFDDTEPMATCPACKQSVPLTDDGVFFRHTVKVPVRVDTNPMPAIPMSASVGRIIINNPPSLDVTCTGSGKSAPADNDEE